MVAPHTHPGSTRAEILEEQSLSAILTGAAHLRAGVAAEDREVHQQAAATDRADCARLVACAKTGTTGGQRQLHA